MVRGATPNDAEYVGLPEIRGVLVQDFGGEARPPSRRASRPGDIIVGVDGQPVDYVGQLQQQIVVQPPRRTVKVEVARKGGVRKTFEVKLQALASSKDSASNDSTASNDDGTNDSASACEMSAS